MTPDPAPLAVVGGRLLTGLVDVTSDLAALEGRGLWAVVLPFEGAPVLARFAEARPARPWPGPPWRGPDPSAWTTSLDRTAFCAGVDAVRTAIAAGDVYQVNLTRRLSAPLPAGADIAALGAALGRGNPAPYAAVVRVPLGRLPRRLGVARAVPAARRRPGGVVADQGHRGRRIGASSPKDRAENVMIVDLVRNDLGRVCEWGSVEVPASVRRRAPPRPRPPRVDGDGTAPHGRDAGRDVVAATFPPGSVTGAPKLAALDHIARLETGAPGRLLRRGRVGRRRRPPRRAQRRHPHLLGRGRPPALRHRRRHHLGLDPRGRVGRDRAQGATPAGGGLGRRGAQRTLIRVPSGRSASMIP